MNIVAQCCGIVVMLVLMFFYRKQKKIKLNTGTAFMGIWIAILLALIFDIASLVCIHYNDMLPEVLVFGMCKAYLASIVFEALMAVRYICVDIFNSRKAERTWSHRVGVSMMIATIIIFCLPIQAFKEQLVAYTYGPSVLATYIMAVGLLGAIFFLLFKYKDSINKKRRRGVIIWMVIWLAAAFVQFINNSILVVGFASVIGVLIIYLLLENPEANIDRDTGLFNLNAFFLYMRQLKGHRRDVSVVLVSYDTNRNGRMSYDVEKQVMMEIVEFINTTPMSVVFRSSSTEFILVFDKKEDASAAIARVNDRFERSWGDEYKMIVADWYFLTSTEMIERSSDILPIFQFAKQNRAESGADGGIVVDNDMVHRMYDERNMENEIVSAMTEKRVEVFYQPIYSVKDEGFSNAEALVRIRDREGNIIPPGRFIEVAEKRGLIIRLGECVFEEVCKFLVTEDPMKYGLQYIEVNLSVLQCGYERLADSFIAIMEKYNVDPTNIVLEITESASIKQKKILLENMRKLKDVGVRFALDDFGTGQSNLNYIVEMPVDVVKFDSSMTNAYFENGTAKYVMDAAMQMIQGMDLEIVSEGIEEKHQYKVMKEIGIDYIQGFYFSKPVEGQSFLEFLKEKQDDSK